MLIDSRLYGRILDKKRRLDGLRPLPAALVAKLREQLTVEYTYNSNAIEGNTLTLRETRLVVEEGITIGSKSVSEILETKNHPEAIKFIESLADARSDVTEEAVLRLHGVIMRGVVEDAGSYRSTGVRITGASFMPPSSAEVRFQMNQLLDWSRKNVDERTPTEVAAIFHHRFVQIHPFTEGNGRTARLLMNALLMKNGYPFITIISNAERSEYIKALGEADFGNDALFVNFVARCVERSLDVYLNALEEPEVFSLAEASKFTSYSQEYLSLLARKGALGAFKQGRDWRITRTDLNRYLESIKKRKKPKPEKPLN